MTRNIFELTTLLQHRAFRVACLVVAMSAVTMTVHAAAAATQKYKEWTVQCMAERACIAHLDRAGVQILVGRAKANTPVRMAFRIPASAKTGQPVALRLNDGWQAGLRTGNCAKAFCEVGVAEKATDIAITALSRNSGGLIAYQVDDRILLIAFPLDGFREALSQVKK